MKKVIIALVLCAAQSIVLAGNGGAVAGGIFSGMVLGSMMANANQPRYVQAPPQTVVIRDEQPQRTEVIRECYDSRGNRIECPSKRQRLADHPDNY